MSLPDENIKVLKWEPILATLSFPPSRKSFPFPKPPKLEHTTPPETFHLR